MRSKIKAGDLEVGAIVFIGGNTYRIADGRYYMMSATCVDLHAVKLTDQGEVKTVLQLPWDLEVEGHDRIDRLELGRRYRLRDRVNFAEWIGDCLSVYGETPTYASYSILQVGTPLVATHDTADIAVREPEVLEDISPTPGQQVRVLSQNISGTIVSQLTDGRWSIDCGDGIGGFVADIFDLEYNNA
jgi:hypothetical protein